MTEYEEQVLALLRKILETLESPQYKELSDERIDQIAKKFYMSGEVLRDFARAILEEASEK